MSGWILPKEPHLTDLARVSTPHVVAESGTLHGVDWSIIPEHVRRPGFRLTVAGRYIATLDSRIAAHELKRDYIDDLIADGQAGDAL